MSKLVSCSKDFPDECKGCPDYVESYANTTLDTALASWFAFYSGPAYVVRDVQGSTENHTLESKKLDTNSSLPLEDDFSYLGIPSRAYVFTISIEFTVRYLHNHRFGSLKW